MGTVIISIICTLAMWVIGTAMNLKPPGFGTTLAVATMGGFIMFQLYQLKKKK